MDQEQLELCANDAIRLTVKHWRKSIDQSWMILVGNTTLTIPDRAEWMDFVGDVLNKYNQCTDPCVGPELEKLAEFHTEQLIALRDAIVGGTTCP